VPIAYSFNPSTAVPAAPAAPLPDDNAAPGLPGAPTAWPVTVGSPTRVGSGWSTSF